MQCVCGSQSYNKLFQGSHKKKIAGQSKQYIRFSILECTSCNLVQTYPRPYESSEVSEYYQESLDVENRIRNISSHRQYAITYLDYIAQYKKTGKLLEIGCSLGVALKVAQERGYEVLGLDINKMAAEKAQDLFGFHILTESIFNAPIKHGSVDVILLIHILEHIEDPVSFLKQIKLFLKSDGILFIGVPNFDGLMAQRKKATWGGLDPMRHLWQFKPTSLEKILNQAGFQVKTFILNTNMNYEYDLNHAHWFKRKRLSSLLNQAISAHRGDNLFCVAALG